MSTAGQEDSIIFRGGDPEEAEDFIRSVKVQAFRLGKSDDHNWVATFASTAFAGKALRWYMRLPVQTRQDWDRLQEAIIENEWGRDNTSTINSTTVGPLLRPSGGSLPPLPHDQRAVQYHRIHRSHPLAQAGPLQYGSLLTIRPATGTLQWMSYAADVTATLPQRKSSVLVGGLHFLAHCRYSPPKAWLGAQHLNPEHTDVTGQLGPGSAEYLALTPITDLAESPFRTLAHAKDYRYSGRFYVSMWNVLEDLSLVPIVKQSGCTFELGPLVSNSKFKEVILASDSSTIRREYASLNNHMSLEPARLFLEVI